MNIHRQIKRKRIEEGLWDDVKNKTKSLVGKGKPSSEPNPLYKNRLSDIAKDIFELYITPENKTTSSFILKRFDKSKRKEVIDYYKSIGITYNPEIVNKYNAYAKEIRSFFSLLRNDTWGGYERVMNLLGMDESKYKYYFDYKILDYIVNDYSINSIFSKISSIEGLEGSFYVDMDAKRMLEIVLRNVKETIDIRIFKKCDRIKQGIAFVKKQMDTVVNSDPSSIKLGIVKSKDELYNLFKYFYPNERVDEFVKKFNINKSIVLGNAEKFLPSEEGMKNMMKSKYGEKKIMTLKSYLEKKLTVSSKEAELIESVIKEYVKKKKIEEGKFSNLIGNVAQGVKNLFVSKDNMPIAINSVRRFSNSFIEFVSDVAYIAESGFKKQLENATQYRGMSTPPTNMRAEVLNLDTYLECYSFMKSKVVNSILKYPDSKDFAFKDNDNYDPSDSEIDFKVYNVGADTFSDIKNNPRFSIIVKVAIGDTEYNIDFHPTDYRYKYEKTIVFIKKGRDVISELEYTSNFSDSRRFKFYLEFKVKELLSEFLSQKYGEKLANKLLSFRTYKS